MDNGIPLLSLTDDIANHLRIRFKDLINNRTPKPFPGHWTLHSTVQCARSARIMAAAYLSPGGYI